MSADLSPPGVDPTLPPRLHELGEYKFQRLINELMALEPNIATSDEYGMRGQADDGADVMARRTGSDGHEVASCKCYPRTTAGQVKDWSDEFLDHWGEHWSGQDIRRFVLATTADNLASRPIQDQITQEAARFKALGVDYEVWGPKDVVARLRPQRAIATTYLTPAWAVQICGPVAEAGITTAPAPNFVSEALIGQIADLQGRLSQQTDQAIDRAQSDLKTGRSGAVRTFIAEQRSAAIWPQLQAVVQAKVLRLAASLALEDEDLAAAEALAAEADTLCRQDEPRLAARLALEHDGASAALAVLGNVTSLAGLQMRIALGAMAGELRGARIDLATVVAKAPDDPETMRMEALVALASGVPEQALIDIRRAEALASDWSAIRQLGAMARYACALSPVIGPDWYMAPNAIDGSFVREDLRSQALLDEAVTLLDQLIAAEPSVLNHRVWRLAVLSSLRAGRERAKAEALDLLTRFDHDPAVIAWCMFRAIDVDLAESEQTLIDRYAAGVDQMTVRVLGLLLLRRETPADSAALLRAGLAVQEGAAKSEAATWIARLEGQADQSGQADGVVPEQALFEEAQVTGDWSTFGARLAELFAAVPADPGALALSENLAAVGQFDLLAPHLAAITAFATAGAIRLAAHIAYRTGAPQQALDLLDTHAGAFGEALPPDMRRLRAEALARLGDVPAALIEADAVASSGATGDRLFRAELLSSTGNILGAIPAVREALSAGLLKGDRAFQWSRMMRIEEPRLARQLLERAITSELGERFVTAAMHDAFTEQMGEHAQHLLARVIARAETNQAPDARKLTSAELPRFLSEQQARAEETHKLYLDGAIPIHLLCAHDPLQLALKYLGPNRREDGALQPWLIRHGARPAAVEYDIPWSDWRIHLDVTALLIAGRLNLLELIEAHPNGAAIPADLPFVLMSMETACRDRASVGIAEKIVGSGIMPAALDDVPAIAIVAVEADEENGALPETRDATGLSTLLAALTQRHILDPEQAQRIANGLIASETERSLEDGDRLILDQGSLERLAAGDVLPLAMAQFELRCAGGLLDHARAAIDQAGLAQAAADALTALRRRVASGLESKTYRPIPRRALEPDGDDEQLSDETQITRCLGDIISAPAAEGAVAWIDDRLVTGYANTATMPVVGISDVLAALRKDGCITTEREGSALAVLRAAGAQFLLPLAEEVVAALLAAPNRGQHIVETPALEAVRRSVALTALHERNLAIGDAVATEQGRPHELEAARAVMRLLGSSLKALWLTDGLSFDRLIAASDWLWLNVRRTHVLRQIPGADQMAAQDNFETIQIANCLDQAVDIGLLNDRRAQTRRDYLHWFWVRAVAPLMAVDHTFRERLTRYLVDFYAEMDKPDSAHSARDRRILHKLLGLRVQRLPDPLQAELYRDPRMAAFGSAEERITVGKAQFEAVRFWRAARQALKYGRAKLRFRPRPKARLRTVRMRRDGSGLILSGAVRARLADELLTVAALSGPQRQAAIEAFVDGLDLPRPQADEVGERASKSGAIDTTVRILRDAAATSARARYADVESRLRRRERFRMDLLAPAPFLATLTYLGLADPTAPLAEALERAYRARYERLGASALIEVAGIPVMRSVDALALWDNVEVRAQARTPLALLHAMAAAQAGGRAADVTALAGRLGDAIERHGRLFTGLLRWSLKCFLQDEAWRAAPQAYALAVVWAHADRILDLVIGARLEPNELRASLRRSEPDVAGRDLLSLHPGPPDVAWPQTISAAALLHHGLRVVFGDADVKAALGDELYTRLAALQLHETGDRVTPEIKLLLRRDDWPNAMGAFLTGSPVGLDSGAFDLKATVALLLDGPLDQLARDPDDFGAWQQVGAFASGGIDADRFERLRALVTADPARLVRLVANDGDLVFWRSIIQPIAWHDADLAVRLVQDIAKTCRRLAEHAGVGSSTIALEPAAAEFIEIAVIMAGLGDDGERRFTEVLETSAEAWPALRPVLHQATGNLAARTPSGRAAIFWQLHNQLGVR